MTKEKLDRKIAEKVRDFVLAKLDKGEYSKRVA